MLRWTARRLSSSAYTTLRCLRLRDSARRPAPTLFHQAASLSRRASSITESSARPSKWRWNPRTGLYLFSLGLFGHIFVVYFYSTSHTYGISMLPTLYSYGDWVILSKYYRRGRGVKVGDVISFKHPARNGEYAIKRVIGMEGDFVLYNTPQNSEAMIQVPQGHCWVVGDNLKHSRDSRMFGPLPMALIHAKVLAKYRNYATEWSWMEHGLQPTDLDDEVD